MKPCKTRTDPMPCDLPAYRTGRRPYSLLFPVASRLLNLNHALRAVPRHLDLPSHSPIVYSLHLFQGGFRNMFANSTPFASPYFAQSCTCGGFDLCEICLRFNAVKQEQKLPFDEIVRAFPEQLQSAYHAAYDQRRSPTEMISMLDGIYRYLGRQRENTGELRLKVSCLQCAFRQFSANALFS
jgi:hypothetical protein